MHLVMISMHVHVTVSRLRHFMLRSSGGWHCCRDLCLPNLPGGVGGVHRAARRQALDGASRHAARRARARLHIRVRALLQHHKQAGQLCRLLAMRRVQLRGSTVGSYEQ